MTKNSVDFCVLITVKIAKQSVAGGDERDVMTGTHRDEDFACGCMGTVPKSGSTPSVCLAMGS